jgi:flagellar biosynthesis protein FlhG
MNKPTQQTRPHLAAANRGSNIIAVCSGKGGVGKTWFSVTLAHTLAEAGKKVLLFDGDLGMANVDVQLGLMPKRDLSYVINNKLTMAQVVEEYPDGGFDIIAGRPGKASLSSLPNRRLVRLRDDIMQLAKKYDHLIIDLGAGIDRTVRVLSGMAETLYVVTNQEPTAMTDAYAFIKLTHTAGLSDAIKLVINTVPDKKEGERIYKTLLKACRHFLNIHPPLAGLIHRDSNVLDAIRRQTPLLVRHPNTQAAVDVERIAKDYLHSRQQATG